jgi:Tfp pilus assembly protein PilZ
MTDALRNRAPRQHVSMPLIYDRGDRYVAANLLDISETGLLLSGDETAPVGKQVTLYADLNDHQSWPIHIEGLVVRHADTNIMGVRFMYASVAQLAQMRLFVQAIGEQPVTMQLAASSDDDKAHKGHRSDDEEETPEGEPTFEALSNGERKEEIEGETEAAEGESLDTIDQHEVNRAEEREEQAEEKAESPKEKCEEVEKKNDTTKQAADADDDDIVQKMSADRKAWTTLTGCGDVDESDFAALNLDRELALLDGTDAPNVTARREYAIEEALLDGETDTAQRPRALRASLTEVYGVLDLDEHFSVGAILDLSETGFFIATDEVVELGQDLTFIPNDIDDESLPLELSARVVRIEDAERNRPRGIACRLTRLSLAERDALKSYLRSKYLV